jgi:hypothetical protein
MGNHRQTASFRTPLALDDLPDDQLVDAMALLYWLRLIRRTWYVRYGSEQYHIAENLNLCGFVWLSFSDGDDMNAVGVNLTTQGVQA